MELRRLGGGVECNDLEISVMYFLSRVPQLRNYRITLKGKIIDSGVNYEFLSRELNMALYPEELARGIQVRTPSSTEMMMKNKRLYLREIAEKFHSLSRKRSA